jgi:hypothetical protein
MSSAPAILDRPSRQTERKVAARPCPARVATAEITLAQLLNGAELKPARPHFNFS